MITNQDYIIDSRDINRRIEELARIGDLMSFEIEELDCLRQLAQQGELLSPQWQTGVTLLRADVLQQGAIVSFAGTAYALMKEPLQPRRIQREQELDIMRSRGEL